MLYFESDYTEGAHEKVLQHLLETNLVSQSGYGNDIYCESARQKILRACSCPDGDVRFLVGGTQTNMTVIDALLKSYEAVFSAKTGHIHGHEAGAVEFTGHKILELPQYEGKISASDLKNYLVNFFADATHEHMAIPGMVYISHPTEYGTLYSKAELESIYAVCREYALPLFVDGARLGYGVMSRRTDVTMSVLAENCDVFYVGGTKVGALCGEAVVFTKTKAPKYFLTTIKQHGALLAKGRVLGVQFDALFTDDLYFKISRHAIDMAEKLREAFSSKGYEFFMDSPTNQQFVILDRETYDKLAQSVKFTTWEHLADGRIVVRFVTSWATTPEQIDALAALL